MQVADTLKRWLPIVTASFALCATAHTFGIGAETGGNAAGVSGGLCVQIGGEQTSFAAELAGTGRFLVHVLCRDAKTVEDTRQKLKPQVEHQHKPT